MYQISAATKRRSDVNRFRHLVEIRAFLQEGLRLGINAVPQNRLLILHLFVRTPLLGSYKAPTPPGLPAANDHSRYRTVSIHIPIRGMVLI